MSEFVVREFVTSGTAVHVGLDALSASQDAIVSAVGRRPFTVVGARALASGSVSRALEVLERFTEPVLHVKEGSAKDALVVAAAIEAFRTSTSTGVIALGGGDALDLGKQVSHFGRDTVRIEAALTPDGPRSIPVSMPDSAVPLVTIPQSLAGSGLSAWATLRLAGDAPSRPEATRPVRSLALRGRLALAIYDGPAFDSTPRSHLQAGFFNGLHKGVESLYASSASPLSDATSILGCRRLLQGYTWLTSDHGQDGALLEALLEGIVLVQIHRRLSILHAVGHGLSRAARVAQGLVHAAISTAALTWVVDRLDPRRAAIMLEALAPDGSGWEAAVANLSQVRSELGLPTGLGALPTVHVTNSVLQEIAADRLLRNAPTELATSVEELAGLVQSSY